MTNFNTKLSILTGTGRFYEEIWYNLEQMALIKIEILENKM